MAKTAVAVEEVTKVEFTKKTGGVDIETKEGGRGEEKSRGGEERVEKTGKRGVGRI
jgi:hypothetical protein